MQICCQSPPPQAEARKIGFWGSFVENDLKPLPEIEFGPVVNDPKCGRQVIKSAVNLGDKVNSLTAAYCIIRFQMIARRRVVGGSNAGFGRFPWQALIQIGKSR